MSVYQYFRHNYLYVQAKIHIYKQQNEKSENILTEYVNHVISCSHSVTHTFMTTVKVKTLNPVLGVGKWEGTVIARATASGVKLWDGGTL